MKAFKVMLTVALMAVLFTTVSVLAQPGMINYQGKLTDDAGVPVTATVSIVFSIYDVATGGTALWTETQSLVNIQDGIYNVLLGSTTVIPEAVFDGNDRWLGVKVGADSEMSPRQRIASVAYAMRAGSAEQADKVDGIHASTIPEPNKLLALGADGKFPFGAFPSSVQIKTGTYVGNGGATQSITGVGFQPKIVLVYPQGEAGHIAWVLKTNMDSTHSSLNKQSYIRYKEDNIISFDADGFAVGDGTGYGNHLNTNGLSYGYIAVIF